ncbi:MAG TPA: ABC transporter ATP-binding protein, partial [Exiguobacterium sp.]|nr:ABC transporter ATP-binding protein [Exiguobacterium sp.]
MFHMHVSIQQAGYDIGQPVLHEIAFALQPGSITGLIGMNGAGKSRS